MSRDKNVAAIIRHDMELHDRIHTLEAEVERLKNRERALLDVAEAAERGVNDMMHGHARDALRQALTRLKNIDQEVGG